MYFVYLFRCQDGSLYTGSTTNVQKREQLHNSGRGAKYVRSRGGGAMAYVERFYSKSRALKREAEIKKWPRAKKLLLVKKKNAG